MQQLQKTYSLPNCTLVLDGMSDASGVTGGGAMALLTHAACRFMGHDQDLSGGSDFFNSLVPAVSQYAQERLSGLKSGKVAQGLVKIEPTDQGRHQLSVAPEADGLSTGDQGDEQKFELTTVQLFDLVEAIDQFLSDRSTLPDKQLSLQPISKRQAPSQTPIAQRVAAPALGAVGLAAAAAALFALDVPNLRRPLEDTGAKAAQTSGKTPGQKSPAGVESVDPDSVQDPGVSSPAITDAAELARIEDVVWESVDSTWNQYPLPTFKQDAVYRVSVSEAGEIIGYRGVDEASRNVVDQLPLEKLLYTPPTDAAISDEPLAEFKMTFTPDAVLRVEPWSGSESAAAAPAADAATAPATPDASKTDTSQTDTSTADSTETEPAQTEPVQAKPAEPDQSALDQANLDELTTSALNADLYNSVNAAWKNDFQPDADLEFRVKVNIDSDIVSYEPLNEAAKTADVKAPLAALKKAGAAGESSDFKVVFKADGKLEVSPWEGSAKP